MTRSHSLPERIAKILSYMVFITWALITILPLIWMGYSSFKTNEELVRDIYKLPNELIFNQNHEFVVIERTLNVMLPYDPDQDPRERIIIESTSIAPTRRLMVYFLIKEDMPAEIQRLTPGDRIELRDLPLFTRTRIGWQMIWFNYISAFVRGGLGGKFFNSLLYAGAGTFLIVIFGLMIGFALAKLGFPKISKFISVIIGLGYLLSINSVIIPLFLLLRSVGLTDSHLGIILVYTAFGLPMSVLLSTQFIKGLPNSLLESAYIDGAGVFRTFWSILLPMTVPVIITVSIINALGIWNEFLLVLVLASSEATKSLPVGVFSFSSLTSQQLGWQIAALVIAVVPAMAVYFSFSKQLTQGVVGGAIKG
jgi:raffinose/stachyose/melibiose transport system permease protein